MAKIPISRGLAYHLFCEPTVAHAAHEKPAQAGFFCVQFRLEARYDAALASQTGGGRIVEKRLKKEQSIDSSMRNEGFR